MNNIIIFNTEKKKKQSIDNPSYTNKNVYI